MTTTPPANQISVSNVIQLHPDYSDWGPLLCIVDRVYDWGVRAYWFVAEERGKPPGRAYIRVRHGEYDVIGYAATLCTDDLTDNPHSSPITKDDY